MTEAIIGTAETPKGSPFFRIRDYQRGDEVEICTLFKTVFGKTLTILQWEWKYLQQNSDGKVFAIVALNETGQIIGHAGAIRLRGVHHVQPIEIFQIADVMVLSSYRGGMGRGNIFTCLLRGLLDMLRECTGDEVFAYGFPGERPYVVGERAGVYERIENITINELPPSIISSLRIKTLSWEDSRIDVLWEKFSSSLGIALVRDREYLSWRYQANPFFTYRLLGVFGLLGLIGWAVAREESGKAHIVDMLLPASRLEGGLRAIARNLRANGYGCVDFWLPQRLLHGLKMTRLPTGVVAANMTWNLTEFNTETVRNKLYFTMGDADIH